MIINTVKGPASILVNRFRGRLKEAFWILGFNPKQAAWEREDSPAEEVDGALARESGDLREVPLCPPY